MQDLFEMDDRNSILTGIEALKKNKLQEAEEILPSNGTLVIIPSGRTHSSSYNGKKDRVMIGVNFYSLN